MRNSKILSQWRKFFWKKNVPLTLCLDLGGLSSDVHGFIQRELLIYKMFPSHELGLESKMLPVALHS